MSIEQKRPCVRERRGINRTRLVRLIGYYSNNMREEWVFEPNNRAVEWARFSRLDGLEKAGDEACRESVAEKLAIDIKGGTTVQLVIDWLDAMGIDSLNEHPGYISIALAGGCSWAIGDANDSWMGDMIDANGKAFKVDQSFDTRISSDKNDEADPVVIASAIAKEVVEVGGFVPTFDACVRSINYAIAEEAKDKAGVNGMCAAEPEQSRFVALALLGLYGWMGDETIRGATMAEVKEAFLASVGSVGELEPQKVAAKIVEIAENHAEETSEVGHAIGDLEEALKLCLERLPEEVRARILREVRAISQEA